MSQMMMVMMMGVCCCVVVAGGGGALFYLTAPTPTPTGVPTPTGSATPAGKGKSSSTGGKAAPPVNADGTYTRTNKNKSAMVVPDGSIYNIVAVAGANRYLFARRGGATKRCSNYTDFTGGTTNASYGAGDKVWGQWRFQKSATAGSSTKPQYFIRNVARDAQCDGNNGGHIAPADLTTCAGQPNGAIRAYNGNEVTETTGLWIVWKDGDAVVLESQLCKSLNLETRYLLLNTSVATDGKNLTLSTWEGATRFKLVAAT